jgi:RNA polymerase sigma-70 factor (ECF subfamily)
MPSASGQARLVDEHLLSRAFERSNGRRWGLSRETFVRALDRSIASRFATEVKTPAAVADYVGSLNLEELALACACAEGHVAAWAYFIECHRPGLRAAARAIAGEEGGAELADTLYAELYGIEERDGCRRSLFDYFHGRSRLSTWLRSILAQRNIDRLRAARRLQPLEDERGAQVAAPDPPDPERIRLAGLAQAALSVVIRRLEPRDRLRLSSYYLQHLTLAQIGRLFGEHEATVSRKLDRLRRDLRAGAERVLREEYRLGESRVTACLACAVEDAGWDLERVLQARASPGTGQESA